MSIRKSPEVNQRHRRKLGLRLVGSSVVALVVAVGGAAAVVLDGPLMPVPQAGGGGEAEPSGPVEPTVRELAAAESSADEATFEGAVDVNEVVVMPLVSGAGLVTVEVALRDPSFSGVLSVGGDDHPVGRGGGTVHANVLDGGPVDLRLVGDGEVGTQFRLSVVHPAAG